MRRSATHRCRGLERIKQGEVRQGGDARLSIGWLVWSSAARRSPLTSACSSAAISPESSSRRIEPSRWPASTSSAHLATHPSIGPLECTCCLGVDTRPVHEREPDARLGLITAENLLTGCGNRSAAVDLGAGAFEALEIDSFDLAQRLVEELILVGEVVLEYPGRPARLESNGARSLPTPCPHDRSARSAAWASSRRRSS